jgi:8-oxo-dGTP pyrophosphatase MutT (NUDIX family)
MTATVRHFTATGFVVHRERLLLHWHPKVRAWLPPGGHVDDNEDPVQAVLREILEESGVEARVVPTGVQLGLDYPASVAPPFTIMVEDIDDAVAGFHQHIDMIYFCALAGPDGPINDGWTWVAKGDVAGGTPLARPDGPSEPPPEDVRVLAGFAFEIVGRASSSSELGSALEPAPSPIRG